MRPTPVPVDWPGERSLIQLWGLLPVGSLRTGVARKPSSLLAVTGSEGITSGGPGRSVWVSMPGVGCAASCGWGRERPGPKAEGGGRTDSRGRESSFRAIGRAGAIAHCRDASRDTLVGFRVEMNPRTAYVLGRRMRTPRGLATAIVPCKASRSWAPSVRPRSSRIGLMPAWLGRNSRTPAWLPGG